MKLSKKQLKKIIQEEIQKVLLEAIEDCPSLQKGSKGPKEKRCIANVQTSLNSKDPLLKLTVDGDYGDKTKSAVIKFQQTAGYAPAELSPIGILQAGKRDHLDLTQMTHLEE